MTKSDELTKLFGKKMGHMRRVFGDTQEELAEGLNTTPNSISAIERGKTENVLIYLPSILDYYGKTFEEFLEEY